MKNKIFDTPLGWAGVAVSEQGVARIVLPKKSKRAVERELSGGESARLSPSRAKYTPNAEKSTRKTTVVLKRAVQLLKKYFSGKVVLFDLPLDLRYYTHFQQAVWNAASEIRSGETRPYGWIARKIKNPNASRAVGQAMGANPIPIIIP